jgi:uncharacterized repeat protein (TIGR01451 family)
MRKHWVWIFLITVLLTGITAIAVMAVPPQPYVPYGKVTLNDEDLPEGTEIIAMCGGVQFGVTQSVILEGKSWYTIDVLGDDPDTAHKDGCNPDETVIFKLLSMEADQQGLWVSGSQRLDLTFYKPLAQIALETRVNDQDADTSPGPYLLAGTSLTWTYIVNNPGEVALSNVVVIDDNGTPGDASDDIQVCGPFTLAVGSSQTCSLAGTAQPGQYVNIATASGTPPEDPPVSASDPAHYFGVTLNTSIVKKTNAQDANTAPGVILEVGDNVTWAYVVTNNGNVTLTDVSVSDDQGVTVSCPKNSLAAGESMTCTATGQATAGQYANIGTVTGVPPVGPNVEASDPSHYFGSAPAISMVKKTNTTQTTQPEDLYILVGDPVTWTYALENTGNVKLTGISVVDDNGTPGNPGDDRSAACTATTLEPGGTTTCTLSGTAIKGAYHNVATVTATPPVGSNVTKTAHSYYFGADPQVEVEFKVNGNNADSAPGVIVLAGSSLTLDYAVTNTGNVALSGLTVSDSLGYTCNIASLAVGATNTACTRTINALIGQQSASATVTGTPPGGLAPITSAPDWIYYLGAQPAIDLQKKTNGFDADSPTGPLIKIGQPVTWTYEVTNTGNVTLTGILVTDDKLGTITCPGSTLDAGASMTCSASGSAVAGQYANMGTVTGTPPVGSNVTDSDPSHYYGSDVGVAIKKLTNGVDIDQTDPPYILVGDPVSWTYVVSNVGNIQLTGVAVTDSDSTLTVACPKTTLDPDESMTCTASGTAVAGVYTNTGYVEGTPSGFTEKVGASDVSGYFGAQPAISITKYTNGQDAKEAPGPYIPVGEAVTFTYQVSNTETAFQFTNIVVTDESGLEPVCPKQPSTRVKTWFARSKGWLRSASNPRRARSTPRPLCRQPRLSWARSRRVIPAITLAIRWVWRWRSAPTARLRWNRQARGFRLTAW